VRFDFSTESFAFRRAVAGSSPRSRPPYKASISWAVEDASLTSHREAMTLRLPARKNAQARPTSPSPAKARVPAPLHAKWSPIVPSTGAPRWSGHIAYRYHLPCSDSRQIREVRLARGAMRHKVQIRVLFRIALQTGGCRRLFSCEYFALRLRKMEGDFLHLRRRLR
jgi:hypothetical protein